MTKLQTSLSGRIQASEVNNYHVFSQVQLWVGNGKYMTADAVLVKFDDAGRIVDVIVVENKISAGTSLSPNQGAGFRRIRDNKTLKVKVPRTSHGTGIKLKVNDDLSITGITKTAKVSDGGDPEGVFNYKTNFHTELTD